MFTLAELNFLQELSKKAAVGYDHVDVAAAVKKKLLDGIADLESRENRAKAARQLKAVSDAVPMVAETAAGE